jgi:P27 family predicted phage terminase small subunit
VAEAERAAPVTKLASKRPKSPPKPPKHLGAAGRALWRETLRDGFEIEERWEHETLAAACVLVDRAHEARAVLERDGVTSLDRYDRPKAHPAALLERDSIKGMLACFQALGLRPEKGTPGAEVVS